MLCHALNICMTAPECCCNAKLAESRLITASGVDTACLPVLSRQIFVVQRLIVTDYQQTADSCQQILATFRIEGLMCFIGLESENNCLNKLWFYTCAFKPGCLMSHNWLHSPDCKVSNEMKWKWMSCMHREGVVLGL